jgi:hypothetical protein
MLNGENNGSGKVGMHMSPSSSFFLTLTCC